MQSADIDLKYPWLNLTVMTFSDSVQYYVIDRFVTGHKFFVCSRKETSADVMDLQMIIIRNQRHCRQEYIPVIIRIVIVNNTWLHHNDFLCDNCELQ